MIQTDLEEMFGWFENYLWKPKTETWNTIADVAVAFVYPVSTGDDGERTYVKFESSGPAFRGGGISWVEIWAEACCTAC